MQPAGWGRAGFEEELGLLGRSGNVVVHPYHPLPSRGFSQCSGDSLLEKEEEEEKEEKEDDAEGVRPPSSQQPFSYS